MSSNRSSGIFGPVTSVFRSKNRAGKTQSTESIDAVSSDETPTPKTTSAPSVQSPMQKPQQPPKLRTSTPSGNIKLANSTPSSAPISPVSPSTTVTSATTWPTAPTSDSSTTMGLTEPPTSKTLINGNGTALSPAAAAITPYLFDHRRELAKMNDSQKSSARSSVDIKSRSSADIPRSSLDSGRTGNSADLPTHPNELNTIAQLPRLPLGTEVNFRARIETQRQVSKALDFLLLRDQTHSIQAVLSRDNLDMVKWVQKLRPESLLQINGQLKTPPEPVRSATVSDVEVAINTVYLVNAAGSAPFTNYKPPQTLRNRMSSRILDLRHPANQALFRVRSLVSRKFRETLEEKGFVEINTPKLQPAATESGDRKSVV